MQLWKEKLKKTLKLFGFIELAPFERVLRFKNGKSEVVMEVYVDDLGIFSAEIRGITWAEDELKPLSKLTELEDSYFYLGISSC